MMTLSNPALILNLRKLDSETNLLANPHVRVRNREKAKVHVGERVPVITTTSTANVGVSQSVNYLDVGLKLEVEPNIYLDDDVAIKVGLEVSNIIEQIKQTSGLLAYRLGTRNASTTLRLKDGETQILAGLIQNDERRSTNKVPGLSDLPIVGRLFSNRSDDNQKTEIVLLITPRVVRNIVRPSADMAEFASGTEGAMGAGLGGGTQAPFVPAGPMPTLSPPPTPTPSPTTPPTGPSFPAPGMPGAPGGPPPVFPSPTAVPPGSAQPFMPGAPPQ